MVNFQDIIFISSAAGFKRSGGYNVSANVSATNLTVGVAIFFTITTPMENADAISMLQVQFDPQDSFYRQVEGYTFAQFPSAASPQYEIGCASFFTGSEHKLFVYVANQTGGTVSVPAWTLRINLSVYDSPFA